MLLTAWQQFVFSCVIAWRHPGDSCWISDWFIISTAGWIWMDAWLNHLKKTLICCAFGDVDLFRSINGLQNETKIIINPPIPAEKKLVKTCRGRYGMWWKNVIAGSIIIMKMEGNTYCFPYLHWQTFTSTGCTQINAWCSLRTFFGHSRLNSRA